ncbi:MAG TPA: choice-of-anchor D domain-containing protein [Candidatus Binataceae bacterium]
MKDLVRWRVLLAAAVVWLAGAMFLSVPAAMAGDVEPQASLGFAGVLTYHNDNARTGQNLNETILTPANVTRKGFGQLFTDPVDGYLYAQPLYLPGVTIANKGVHNVVYAATQNDSVYAFDADKPGSPLWKVSFINPPSVTTLAVPGDVFGCGDTPVQIGVVSTPVIDPATGTLYVVAKTKENGAPVFRIHALDTTSGAEKFNGPIVISASVVNPVGGAMVPFDPAHANQRQALALVNGIVYIGFSSYCDIDPYHGWMLSYAVQSGTLTRTAAWADTPNGTRGGIWQAGGGPAADSSGTLYNSTGNGTFDADSAGPDYAQAVVKFGSGTLTPLDYFSPFDEQVLSNNDQDLGSAGIVLLPDQTTSIPHLMVTSDKAGIIFLIDRDNLGQFVSTPPDQIVQEITGQLGNMYSTPTYWNGQVYFIPFDDSPKAFSLVTVSVNGNPTTNLSSVPIENTNFVPSFPGATASISANGSSAGILWFISRLGGTSGDAQLVALNAANIGNELYDSNQEGARDLPGLGVKFVPPTVANGKVYVPTQTQLAVYGLLPLMLSVTPGSLSFGNVAVHVRSKSQKVTLRNTTGTTASGITIVTPAPFSKGTTCGKTLASGASCTIQVLVTPTVPGALNKTMTISSSIGSPATVSLSANAVAGTREGLARPGGEQ